MPHNRFFLDAPFHLDEELLLEGEEAHHLLRVMRNQVGDGVEIVNGKGQLAEALIQKSEKKAAYLRLTAIQEESRPPHEVILCQALPRLSRLEMIIEKGTELGMTELWLFPGDLSEKKELSSHQQERLHAIATAAMKQSGRLYLPKIIYKPPLIQWPSTSLRSYFGDTDPQAPPFLELLSQHPLESLLFFVGPEAGFTEREEAFLKKQNGQGVRLNRHILRTETAPLAALAVISNFFLTKY